MNFGFSAGMNTSETPTVEQSLCALSDAIGKANDDLRMCRRMIDRARADISWRATSVSRDVVWDAERVVKNLSMTDESLRDVLRDLQDR
jgi:alkylation response protein AidB-like acyl-CoA dehydrogenase